MISTDARPPTDCETLDAYLVSMGIDHFSAREIEIAAEWIRERMGHPLIVGNCYRPEPYNSQVGGARRSQHLYLRAVDLDLPTSKRTPENMAKFYQTAAELWLTQGRDLAMGLGLYQPWAGARVHIDRGYRRRHWTRRYTGPILESLR